MFGYDPGVADDKLSLTIRVLEQEATQGFLLESLRLKFDSDRAFCSTDLSAWWQPSTNLHWVYGSFPYGGKRYRGSTSVNDDDFVAMQSAHEYQQIVNRIYFAVRLEIRNQLRAAEINEIEVTTVKGGTKVLAQEPTEEQAAAIMARLAAAASASSPGTTPPSSAPDDA